MPKANNQKILITCEHGGNLIPEQYAKAFEGAEPILVSHRGLDIGALELFQQFTKKADFSLYSKTSRLLVELNRSLHHAQLFSEFTRPLSDSEKQEIIRQFYLPYRNEIEEKIQAWVSEGFSVLHLSVHTFTPVLNGKVRKADIGLLYDPGREGEQLFSAHWRNHLQALAPELRIRYNYPYKGTADGFVTQLRKHYTKEQYCGLELEVNQRFPEQDREEWDQLKRKIVKSFLAVF